MSTVYLGLGSNLGNREANLRAALRGLFRMGRVEAVSSLYETQPVGPSQPAYYNAACRYETGLEPRPLLRFLKALEHELGRRPGDTWSPRPVDVDILLYDERTVTEDDLLVPHPRLAERPFVLAPLSEIAPEVRRPTEARTMVEMLREVGSEGVRRVQDAGWEDLGAVRDEKLRL